MQIDESNLLRQLAIVVKTGPVSRGLWAVVCGRNLLSRSIKLLEMKSWVRASTLFETRYGVEPTEICAKGWRKLVSVFWRNRSKRRGYRQFHAAINNEFGYCIRSAFWEHLHGEQMTAFYERKSRYVFHFVTAPAAAQIELICKNGESTFIGSKRTFP